VRRAPPGPLHPASAGRVWAAVHEVSGDGMASVGGDVAGDDRNDSGVIRIYPNGIKIIQPSVAPNAFGATLGNGSEMPSTLKGLGSGAGLRRARVMQPRWGWAIILDDDPG